MGEGIRVPYGDGVSAVDRTSRAIVLLTAQALRELVVRGYRRERHTKLEVHEEGLPIWVTVNGERSFVIDFELDESAMRMQGLTVQGRWLSLPPKRFILIRWWNRLMAWIRSE